MRAPLSWLRDYAPLDASVERLTEVLSELGLVVDGVERFGEGLEDVVVAKVLEIRTHPDADRIRLVDVDPGDGGPLQIVCGAWNFQVGDLVPLAPVGAVLPGDFKISKRKMRGEVSNGMLCSPGELNLPTDPDAEDGLLILPPDVAPPGTPVAEALGIEPDIVFDLDITPNRPDALSMAGVARDLAAALTETWAPPPAPVEVPVTEDLGRPSITVASGDLCPRFTGTILESVPEGPSPAWMARRLTLAGMRPINAVVDVSNYVMLDLGQPNHAYDLDRLGGGGIHVRRARPGETLETLDGVERTLIDDDCVICDAESSPVGVAGIMGGATAEIGEGTARVLLEAAWFLPMAIARTGKRIGLHSEARVRFERGVDPEVATEAVERFVTLLASVPGGEGLRRGPLVDVRDAASMPVAPVIRLRTPRVNHLLGTELDDAAIAALLTPIGFQCASEAAGTYRVTVPTWRLECTREIDLVEEVARMWGYRRIERTIPTGSRGRTAGLDARQRERRRIRHVLSGAGYSEAWTTTFLGPGDLERTGLADDVSRAVEVENPLDKSESILRTALLPGLLKAVRFNTDRQAPSVALYEIGRVFAAPAAGAAVPTPIESEYLGVIVLPEAGGSGGRGGGTAGAGGGGSGAGGGGSGAAGGGSGAAGGGSGGRPGRSGRSGPSSATDWAAVAAVTRTWGWLSESLRLSDVLMRAEEIPGLHPGRSAGIYGSSGRRLGHVGEVSPEVLAGYDLTGRIGYLAVSLDDLLEEPRTERVAHDVSRYPASDIDLAFVVAEEVPASAVQATLVSAGGDVLESAVLFDVFRGAQLGAGRRSLAFRLRFRAIDRTLGESDLTALRRTAIEAVTAAHGAELRG